MTLDKLITHLREQEVHIFDDGTALKLQAPKGIITPQLLEVVTLYSADIQYLVRLGDARVCPARWEHRPLMEVLPNSSYVHLPCVPKRNCCVTHTFFEPLQASKVMN